MVLIKPDQLVPKGASDGLAPTRENVARSLVESVHVSGQINEDFAKLTVELLIVVKGAEPVWAPIRLDALFLIGAREGKLDLALRRGEQARWQVRLAGQGEHRVQVELRAPIIAAGVRKSFTLAIPEAASTSVDLDYSHGESDIAIGGEEVLGQHEPGNGERAHLSAHLEPRSDLIVSWATRAEPGAGGSPLLTAKGEIAIDIDEEQVRTRSSWAVRCVLGATRSLEMRLGPDDEVTEFQIDDQPAEASIDRVRGTDKLTIGLVDPLRAGGVKRLVMKTRRSFARAAPARFRLPGFPWSTRANKRALSASRTVRTCSSGRPRLKGCALLTPTNCRPIYAPSLDQPRV